jgi:hypothetical protein
MSVIPQPPYSWLSPLSFSVSCHVDITEEIKAESQAVLNTFTEHNLKDALKMAEALKMVHKRKRGPTSRVMVDLKAS